LLTATPSRANVFTSADFENFADLLGKTIKVQRDVQDTLNASLAAAQGATGGCLIKFQPMIQEVIIELRATGLIIGIESQMSNVPDDKVAIKVLTMEIKSLEHTLDMQRKFVNSNMGFCSTNGVVAAKGQEILRAFDEVAAWHRSISKKVDPAP
jgi:hypothetical protein